MRARLSLSGRIQPGIQLDKRLKLFFCRADIDDITAILAVITSCHAMASWSNTSCP